MSLRLPDYLHNNIREIANNEHISVNQLVMTAIAEKVSALATEKYLNALSAKGSTEVFDAVMAKVRNRSPLPGDEMYPETDESKQNKFVIGATPPPLSEAANKQISLQRPSKKAAKLAANAAKAKVVIK
jgi:hypothetical protein